MNKTIEIRRDKLCRGTYFADYAQCDGRACSMGQYAQQQPGFLGADEHAALVAVDAVRAALRMAGVETADITQNNDSLLMPGVTAEQRAVLEEIIIATFAQGGVTATFTGEYLT